MLFLLPWDGLWVSEKANKWEREKEREGRIETNSNKLLWICETRPQNHQQQEMNINNNSIEYTHHVWWTERCFRIIFFESKRERKQKNLRKKVCFKYCWKISLLLLLLMFIIASSSPSYILFFRLFLLSIFAAGGVFFSCLLFNSMKFETNFLWRRIFDDNLMRSKFPVQ